MLDTKRLVRVGLAKAKDHIAWQEGISLEKAAGSSIAKLRLRVVVARFQLAKDMKGQCGYSAAAPVATQRLTVSRSYYAMYHAFRAAAYIHYLGDDHQQHSDLPQKLPSDFPDAAAWGNQLKSAREYRNQADYDPYPKSSNYWKSTAKVVFDDASSLLPVARNYLIGKGCNL